MRTISLDGFCSDGDESLAFNGGATSIPTGRAAKLSFDSKARSATGGFQREWRIRTVGHELLFADAARVAARD